jgi:hypothetical protein
MGPSANAIFLSDIHQIASGVDATVAVLSVLSNRKSRVCIPGRRHRRPLTGPAALKDSALPASVWANASRSPSPAASSLPHRSTRRDATGGYVFSHPLGCSKYTRAVQVAGGRATAEIIEHRETLAMSDGPQIPGVANPIGKPITFGEGTGDPYLELPAGNKSRKALLDNRIGRFRVT